jgi:hypothetical protein
VADDVLTQAHTGCTSAQDFNSDKGNAHARVCTYVHVSSFETQRPLWWRVCVRVPAGGGGLSLLSQRSHSAYLGPLSTS